MEIPQPLWSRRPSALNHQRYIHHPCHSISCFSAPQVNGEKCGAAHSTQSLLQGMSTGMCVAVVPGRGLLEPLDKSPAGAHAGRAALLGFAGGVWAGGQGERALLGGCGRGPGSGPERGEAEWRNAPALPVGGFDKVGAHRG